MYLFLLGVVVVYVAGLVWAYYSDKKEEALAQSIRNHKLKKLENVYSFVEFASDSNKIYTTEFFTAEEFWDGIFTSDDLANAHLNRCYERGYFQTDDGTTIPVSQIKYAKVITKLGV
jgi:hypothetical protein